MSDWNLVETSWGELHMVPDYEAPRHEVTRHCWCKPFKDGEHWIHSDPPRRRAEPAGAGPVVQTSGVPGDGT